MNRTRLFFIGILALAVGAFASALAYRILQSRTVAAQGDGEDVVVATADIAVGTRVQDKDVRLVHVPADIVPPGSFHQKSRNASGLSACKRYQLGVRLCASWHSG